MVLEIRSLFSIENGSEIQLLILVLREGQKSPELNKQIKIR